MWYVLFILCGLLLAFLLLRIRVRLDISDTQKRLFIGLGKTGPEYDFVNRTKRLHLFGVPLKPSRPIVRPGGIPARSPENLSAVPQRHTSRRRIPIGTWLALVPDILAAGLSFLSGLIRSVVIEQCEGSIRAGAASPDQTGQLFGCYCAVAGAAPAIGTRFSFEPDWTDGPSFAGSVRFSAAVPMYALAYRFLILLFSLPLWQLYKLSRTKPEGVQHGQ
jgi:hypothetical protein